MKLILDHHYQAAIAVGLRRRGVTAATLLEHGWQVLDDDALLDACLADGLTLVTNNVADFTVLARQWQVQGRSHCGLIFTSDRRWPRTRDGSAALSAALFDLCRGGDESWIDRMHWL
ncbi:MAG: DUF5615 family PIN-like protein [Actinomycetales bacterium]|nr:DUF5615 family PIN-like protein [Actinomycetales bacterium]